MTTSFSAWILGTLISQASREVYNTYTSLLSRGYKENHRFETPMYDLISQASQEVDNTYILACSLVDPRKIIGLMGLLPGKQVV